MDQIAFGLSLNTELPKIYSVRVISVHFTEIQTTFHETMYHGFSNYYWALNNPLDTADARVRKRRHGVLADKADLTVDEIGKKHAICNNKNM